jgi:hypothetical protein
MCARLAAPARLDLGDMEKIPNDCPILLPDGEHDINLLMHGCTQAGRISPATLRAALVFLGCSALSFGCAEDPLKGPKPEIAQTTIKLDLPEAPAFDIPGAHPDGTHSVREMRLKSSKLLNTEVQIKGFVTWIYDCVAELQGPDDSAAEIRKKVEADPTMCQRPHFFLGDTQDTTGERSIWVVEVPRKLRADEVRLLSRQERANLPKVPEIKIGDEVIVTGTWNKESPGGFTNSEGLLVYKDLQNLSAK